MRRTASGIIETDTDTAWRVLTGAPFDRDQLILWGDPVLVTHFEQARGILA